MIKPSPKKQLEYEVIFMSLIGKEIEILEAKNKNLIGIKGVLVKETANLLFLEVGGLTKRILKSQVILKAEVEGKPLKIDGRLLLSTVLSRIKKLR